MGAPTLLVNILNSRVEYHKSSSNNTALHAYTLTNPHFIGDLADKSSPSVTSLHHERPLQAKGRRTDALKIMNLESRARAFIGDFNDSEEYNSPLYSDEDSGFREEQGRRMPGGNIRLCVWIVGNGMPPALFVLAVFWMVTTFLIMIMTMLITTRLNLYIQDLSTTELSNLPVDDGVLPPFDQCLCIHCSYNSADSTISQKVICG